MSTRKPDGAASGAAPLAGALLVMKSAGEIVIDRPGRYCQHADETGRGTRRKKIEDDGGAEEIRQDSGKPGRNGVAGVVERFVASDPRRKRLVAEDAKGDGRQRRAEHRRRSVGCSLCGSDGDEGREPRQRQRCRGDQEGSRRHQDAFCGQGIDQRAGRRLGDDAGRRCDRHDHADAGLVPMLYR